MPTTVLVCVQDIVLLYSLGFCTGWSGSYEDARIKNLKNKAAMRLRTTVRTVSARSFEIRGQTALRPDAGVPDTHGPGAVLVPKRLTFFVPPDMFIINGLNCS